MVNGNIWSQTDVQIRWKNIYCTEMSKFWQRWLTSNVKKIIQSHSRLLTDAEILTFNIKILSTVLITSMNYLFCSVRALDELNIVYDDWLNSGPHIFTWTSCIFTQTTRTTGHRSIIFWTKLGPKLLEILISFFCSLVDLCFIRLDPNGKKK